MQQTTALGELGWVNLLAGMPQNDPTGPDARPGGITHIRVYFVDTDLMGVVYHSVYLTWFEIGRTELLRDGGMSYAEVEARGVSLPVTETTFRIRQPALYDDWIRIESRVASVRTREVRFEYTIWRDDVLLVEGSTTHVPVAKAERRATRMPEWLLERLR